MAKRFSKKYRNKVDYLQSTKVMSGCLSVPDATSTLMPQEQAAKTNMVPVVRIQVLSMHS